MTSIISRKKAESYIREPVNDKSLPFWVLLLVWFSTLVGISEAQESKGEIEVLSAQSLELSGYAQVGYTYGDEHKEGFRTRRARLKLKGDILKNIHYKLQIDAVLTPVLVDAQVEMSFIPHAKLTVGQFKIPFSLENLTSSSDLDTINRSQTVEKLCPGRDIGAKGRDIGVTINGEFSSINYTVGIFNGSGINKNDYNDQKDIVGRVAFYLDNSLRFGLSHYNGRYSPDPEAPFIKRNRTGIDLFFIKERFSLKGEYIFARDDETERYGLYIQGGYYFISREIQTIIKYDFFDTMNIRGDRMDVVTIGLNWFFSKKTKFQINYEYRTRKLDKISDHVLLAQLQAGF